MEIIDYNKLGSEKFLDKLFARADLDFGDYSSSVKEIVENVKTKGDEALFGYTKKFDGFQLSEANIKVSQKEIDEAYSKVDDNFIRVINRAIDRITKYHLKQKQKSWIEPDENGEIMGQMIRPIENAGVYSPGGKAAYPSSVIMNIVPAKVAGVKNIFMATPPNKDGEIVAETIVAACEAGIKNIYKIGGAQAIAAMAFGTSSVPKADIVVGPGNIYVALAKKFVYGNVKIDSIAGPSEILIIADEYANPKYVAADLLSQAEHDELASSILVTDSKTLAENVKKELDVQIERLSRKDIAAKSLQDYGGLIVTSDLNQAAELSNRIAPEHLEIYIKEPFSFLTKIKNAGAIFLGANTPEPLGDYMAGTNHILPTNGTARFFSPLSVDDFVKKTSVSYFSKEAFLNIAEDVMTFAEAEGLDAHRNSVKVRIDEKN